MLQIGIYLNRESPKRSESFKLSPSIKEFRMRLRASVTSKATNPKTSVNLTSGPLKTYANFRSHFLAVLLKINIIEFPLSCNNLRENEKILSREYSCRRKSENFTNNHKRAARFALGQGSFVRRANEEERHKCISNKWQVLARLVMAIYYIKNANLKVYSSFLRLIILFEFPFYVLVKSVSEKCISVKFITASRTEGELVTLGFPQFSWEIVRC